MERPENSLDLFDFISERGVSSEAVAKAIFQQATAQTLVTCIDSMTRNQQNEENHNQHVDQNQNQQDEDDHQNHLQSYDHHHRQRTK